MGFGWVLDLPPPLSSWDLLTQESSLANSLLRADRFLLWSTFPTQWLYIDPRTLRWSCTHLQRECWSFPVQLQRKSSCCQTSKPRDSFSQTWPWAWIYRDNCWYIQLMFHQCSLLWLLNTKNFAILRILYTPSSFQSPRPLPSVSPKAPKLRY